MPNHCYSKLKVLGPKRKAENILRFIQSEDAPVDFNKIIPMPDDIYKGDLGPKEREKYGTKNWYDWSIEHWGTKWNSWGHKELESIGMVPDENSVYFSTAWSPCTPVIIKLSRLYPDMGFVLTFVDEGGGFCGKIDFQNGDVVVSNILDFVCQDYADEVGVGPYFWDEDI